MGGMTLPRPRRRRSYRWPSSRITPDHMAGLHALSMRLGRPITALLAEAAEMMILNAEGCASPRCAEHTGATTSSDPGMYDPNNNTRPMGTSHA